MRFFVSYTTSDGEGYARRTKDLLAPAHDAWVWATDHTAGSPTWREIASEILVRDIFLCLLTPASADSDAQIREVNLALNRGKRVITLKHDDADVFPELGGENYERFTEQTFEGVCRRIAAHIEREATLGAQPTTSGPAERLRFIQELRARNSDLRSDRLESATREAQEAYLKTTLPRELVKFAPAKEPDRDFRVISIEETRKLDTFNDPSYHWSMYFEECGRGVALGEKKELTDALLRAEGAPIVEAGDGDRRFVVLGHLIQELADIGVRPQTLFAPVGDLPRFYKHFGSRATWSGGRRELITPSGPLRIVWSSNAAPLEHYILFRPEVGLWRIVPDPDTGKALTVAIGVNQLYDDAINIVVQTMSRFEVLDPHQMRILRVPSQVT
jgi:hypothetical protein